MHRIPERGVNERFLHGGGKKKKGILFDMINGTTVLGGYLSAYYRILPSNHTDRIERSCRIIPPRLYYTRDYLQPRARKNFDPRRPGGSWNPSSENDD